MLRSSREIERRARGKDVHAVALDEAIEQPLERRGGERAPALAVEAVRVVTEPAGGPGEQLVDAALEVLVARLRAEARAADLRLPGSRQRHERIACSPERAHDLRQPRLELGRRRVVRKRE